MMAHFALWDTLPGIQNFSYEEEQRDPLWPTPGDVHNFHYQMFVRWANPPTIQWLEDLNDLANWARIDGVTAVVQ